MIPTEKRLAFLKNIHLFHGMKDDQLSALAEGLGEQSYDPGAIVFKEGGPADYLYLIYSGKVAIVHEEGKKTVTLATFITHDYFGEQALLSARKTRSATARVEQQAVLFLITRQDLNELLHKHHELKLNFDVSMASRRLSRHTRFKWVQPDEVIYFLARKHPIVLYRSLTGPLIVLLLPVFLAAYGGLTKVGPMIYIAILLVIGLALWAVWLVIDWGNDYYIVTNRRVVWLEKVIGVYDSRNEAPLSTVLSVGVETDVLGRTLDFGNVVVRTFVGRITFSHVNHPHQAAHMIDEQWQRTKRVTAQTEADAMKNAIRTRLGLTVQTKPEPPPATPSKSAFPSIYKPNLLKIMGANILKLRYEDSGTITYRKHWFVLFQQAWLPVVILLGMLGIMFVRAINLAGDPSNALIERPEVGTFLLDTIFFSIPFFMIPFILWALYQFVDWRNDIFQVTSDQILDIDRKPFGTEERRVAPLENILSTEYKRIGVMGNLFNYGTVYITVGGMQLAFEDVLDPASVQQDIDQRRVARMAKTKEVQASAERERMAEWLATYHRNAEEFRQMDGSKNSG